MVISHMAIQFYSYHWIVLTGLHLDPQSGQCRGYGLQTIEPHMSSALGCGECMNRRYTKERGKGEFWLIDVI